MYWRIKAKWDGSVISCDKCRGGFLPSLLRHERGKGLNGLIWGYVRAETKDGALNELTEYMFKHGNDI